MTTHKAKHESEAQAPEAAETAQVARVKVGDTVVIRGKVDHISPDGQHVVVVTATGSDAYPAGSRINIQAHQIEVVESEE